MAFVYGDRVKETSLSTGTGAMALAGPAVGFQSFAVGVGAGNECFYGIVNTSDDTWEMGRGTVGAGTLSRDVVISSSNSNLLVNFTAGQKTVYTTVPRDFYDNALDVAAHQGIDHTAAPFNLLSAAAHQSVDHTLAPFNLLDATAHESIDHTAAPLNLVSQTTLPTEHQGIDHTVAPFFLLDTAAHNSLNHFTVITSAIPQVSGPEKTAGTSTFLRSYSPLDIADMAGIHGGGGGPTGKLVNYSYTVDGVADTIAIAPAFPPAYNLVTNATFTTSYGGPTLQHTHTPLNAANLLVVRFNLYVDNAFGHMHLVGLFKDSETNARAHGSEHNSGPNGGAQLFVEYRMVAGTTLPITFKTRVTSSVGLTIYINQKASLTNIGGLAVSWAEVMEIAP